MTLPGGVCIINTLPESKEEAHWQFPKPRRHYYTPTFQGRSTTALFESKEEAPTLSESKEYAPRHFFNSRNMCSDTPYS